MVRSLFLFWGVSRMRYDSYVRLFHCLCHFSRAVFFPTFTNFARYDIVSRNARVKEMLLNLVVCVNLKWKLQMLKFIDAISHFRRIISKCKKVSKEIRTWRSEENSKVNNVVIKYSDNTINFTSQTSSYMTQSVSQKIENAFYIWYYTINASLLRLKR